VLGFLAGLCLLYHWRTTWYVYSIKDNLETFRDNDNFFHCLNHIENLFGHSREKWYLDGKGL
jgi:hypothetical protein